MKKLKYLQSTPNIFLIILITLISCQNNNNDLRTSNDVNSSNINIMEGQSGLVSFGSYSVFIAQGDKTVAEIAKFLGINKNILSEYNGMSDFFKPENGTVLALPLSYNMPKSSIPSFNFNNDEKNTDKEIEKNFSDKLDDDLIHIVKRNETVFKISRVYNISVQSIVERNNLPSDFQIYEDQRLKIPIYRQSAEEEKELSALIDFQDTSVLKSPERPSDTLTKENNQISLEESPSATKQSSFKEFNFFSPMIGDIVKKFNISNNGIRNEGIDIKSNPDSPVYSIYDGIVMLVSKSSGDKLNVLIIKHDGDLLSIYAGLKSVQYQKGERVKKGWRIGLVNDVNNILHFELRKGNTPLDPETFLAY